MIREHKAALDDILDLIYDWQIDGRVGYCLPVIRGKQLEALEVLADERRRDNCKRCDGTGVIDEMPCTHCKPLAGT